MIVLITKQFELGGNIFSEHCHPTDNQIFVQLIRETVDKGNDYSQTGCDTY